MARQFVMAAAIYLVVGVALVVWSLSGLAAGAPRDDWALMIVLPLAWMFSFWPLWGALTMAQRMRAIGATLERVVGRIRAGASPDAADIGELERSATALAARESGLPEIIVRPVVRRGLARLMQRNGATAPEEPASPRAS